MAGTHRSASETAEKLIPPFARAASFLAATSFVTGSDLLVPGYTAI
jgi:hypothetical protein